MTASFWLRIAAAFAFALLVILIVAKASAGTLESVLIPLGLLLWVIAAAIDRARGAPPA